MGAAPSLADYEVNVRRGTDAVTRGELAEARTYFAQAIAERPADPLAHLGLGIVYLHAGSDWADDAAREFASLGPAGGSGWSRHLEIVRGRYGLANRYPRTPSPPRTAKPAASAVQCYASLCGRMPSRPRITRPPLGRRSPIRSPQCAKRRASGVARRLDQSQVRGEDRGCPALQPA